MSSLTQKVALRANGDALVIGRFRRVLVNKQKTESDQKKPISVALCIADPTALVECLLALDGHIDRLVLLSYALPSDSVCLLLQQAGCDVLATDRNDIQTSLRILSPKEAVQSLPGSSCDTTWILTSSGTTGTPKLIPHTLASLSRTVARDKPIPEPKWGLLYDPTRFAGLQVVLQALIGGGVLLAPDINAPLSAQLAHLSKHKCTHLSATPTLWRRMLMAPEFKELELTQITLGGEIVDQRILDSLQKAHPKARITHIYASTEAGVGFAVTDKKAGFPSRYLSNPAAPCTMKLVDGILWLRPSGNIQRDLKESGVLVDDDNFICSGDRVKIVDDRALFVGRDNGTINVGGVKVHPELVEQVIMGLEEVQLVQISSKTSPISGALVVADVLAVEGTDTAALKAKIQTHCRETLIREANPAIIRFVEELNISVAGKLIRKQRQQN